jgi:hypothetical protein
VLKHLLVVDERVSTVQHGMVRASDYLALEKRVDALEEQVRALLGKH